MFFILWQRIRQFPWFKRQIGMIYMEKVFHPQNEWSKLQMLYLTRLNPRFWTRRTVCCIAFAVLWLSDTAVAQNTAMSLIARAGHPLGSSHGDFDSAGQGSATANSKDDNHCISWTRPEVCRIRVPFEARSTAWATTDNDDDAGAIYWTLESFAEIEQPGTLNRFSGFPAAASFTARLTFAGSQEVHFIGRGFDSQRGNVEWDPKPRVDSPFTHYEVSQSGSIARSIATRGSFLKQGTLFWTTNVWNGKPIFKGATVTDALDSLGGRDAPGIPNAPDSPSSPETTLGDLFIPVEVPKEVSGGYLTDPKIYQAPITDTYGTQDRVFFNGTEQSSNEPSEARLAEGFLVANSEAGKPFASFGIADLDSSISYRVYVEDFSETLAGSNEIDFLSSFPEGVSHFFVSGLPEQTTEGIPHVFSATFAEEGISAFGVIPVVIPIVGDYSNDGLLTVADLDVQASAMRDPNANVDLFDENGDGTVDYADRLIWVHDHAGTWIGDANLDGEFNSSDLILVFASGSYENSAGLDTSWNGGDWDGDGGFTSSDLIAAFADGGYERGARTVANPVPEPTGFAALLSGLLACTVVLSARRKNA